MAVGPRPVLGDRRRLALAFALGAVLAVLATLGSVRLLRADRGDQSVLVGDYSTCRPAGPAPGGATRQPPPPLPPRPAGAERPAWIARPAGDQQILSTASLVLPVTSAVTDGHALVVSLMLTSTCPGPVTVTDSRGNAYRTLADVTDGRRHRVLILAAFEVAALGTADSLTLGYPRSSKYHVAVDEFSGITGAGQAAVASGDAGGTAFSTESAPLTCAAGDLQVAAVGTNSGSAPVFSPGWTALPVLPLSSYRLSTAYRLTDTTARCAATGRTTAQWAAALATLR